MVVTECDDHVVSEQDSRLETRWPLAKGPLIVLPDPVLIVVSESFNLAIPAHLAGGLEVSTAAVAS